MPCFDGPCGCCSARRPGRATSGPMIPVAHACRGRRSRGGRGRAGRLRVARRPTRAWPHLPFPDVPADQMGAVFGRLPSLPREEANRIVVAEVFGRLDAQAALPTLTELIRDWRPDVVVRDPCEFGSMVAAAGSGFRRSRWRSAWAGSCRRWPTALDEPLRELERMAGLDDLRGVDRVLATPTFTSVPAGARRPATGGRRSEREPGLALPDRGLRVGSVAARRSGATLPRLWSTSASVRSPARSGTSMPLYPADRRGPGRPAGASPADDRIRLRPGPPRPAAGQRLGDALVAAGRGDARGGRWSSVTAASAPP